MNFSPASLAMAVSVICGCHSGSLFAQQIGSGNASDPTAAVNYVDFRLQAFDLVDDAERKRYALQGAYVFGSAHKFTYAVNYWDTDVSGESESGMESVRAGYLNLQSRQLRNGFGYWLALGAEVIVDQGDLDDGIGNGTDQIAATLGAGWDLGGRNSLVTLVQFYYSIDEEDDLDKVRSTNPQLIWIYDIPEIEGWLKIDDTLSIDHENDYDSSNIIEVQLGTMFTPSIGAYIENLVNSAGVRTYDDGWGLGLRVSF